MQSGAVLQTEAERSRAQVERILAGDQTAFSEIYDAYRPRVRSFIMKRVRVEHEVEDLTQETFFRLYGSLAAFEGRSSLLTWTFGIAQHVCFRYFRQCSRWMLGPNGHDLPDDLPTESSAEQCIDAGRLLERCDQTLARNRHAAHLEIFRLRYGDGRSIRSIAENVGKSNEAVKISLRRSRKKLAEVVPELQFLLSNAPLERPIRRLRKRPLEGAPALRCGGAR